jgi:hypothetical protein
MAQTIAIVLAGIGGAFVHAALQSEGMLSYPSSGPGIYYLTVALVAVVNAFLFASANKLAEQ